MEAFLRLFETVRDILAEKYYPGDPIAKSLAANRIGIVVTHMDTIHHEPFEKLRGYSQKQVAGETAARIVRFLEVDAKIPRKRVAFGSKECQWDEPDIQAFEKKVAEHMEEVKQTEKPHWEVDPDFQFHMQPDLCKVHDELHPFTPETENEYQNLLNAVVC